MPLDGHAYLVSQGWQGKGSGLRHGSISRPVIIAQKKNMAGIGKDRDEAFPFWDHVFTTAASSIKIKVYDSDSEDTESSTPTMTFEKTRTGIISNRRPTAGTPALSGTAIPSEGPSSSSGSSTPRLSIMAAAKQQAARRMLYSMFFRGPILGSDIEETKLQVTETLATVEEAMKEMEVEQDTTLETKRKKNGRGKKRKRDDDDEDVASGNGKGTGRQSDEPESGVAAEEEARRLRKAEKAERKRLKAERRARKEAKRRVKEAKKGEATVTEKDVTLDIEEAEQAGVAEEEAEDLVAPQHGIAAEPRQSSNSKNRDKSSRSSSKSKRKRKTKDAADSSSH